MYQPSLTTVQLAQLLAALPSSQSTRISIARMIGEFMISDSTAADAFVEYRNLCDLGGFDVSGPLAVADLIARVGAGESAYGFEPRGLRWEVFVRGGGAWLDGDKAEEDDQVHARSGSARNRASTACTIAEGDR